jgi:hypothetical protein
VSRAAVRELIEKGKLFSYGEREDSPPTCHSHNGSM